MNTTFDRVETYVVLICPECGTRFGMSQAFFDARKEDKKTWYCPNGHARVFVGESRDDKIQRLTGALDRERTKVEAYRKDLDYAKRATKAQGTRLRKLKERVKHGVCPCCQRTFQNLARHMNRQHPGFGDGEHT